MSIFEHTRSGIVNAGFNPEQLERLADTLVHADNLDVAEARYVDFAAVADTLPWLWDRDFGALVLQDRAAHASREVAQYMLAQAVERARWCATCATSGGEGLARAAHITELAGELEKFRQ